MVCIINILFEVIIFLWSCWTVLLGDVDAKSPFLKWFEKCWDAKKKSGGVAWKEFRAIMKYLTLSYIHYQEANLYYTYTSLVDMTPFIDINWRDEESWDYLINQIYNIKHTVTKPRKTKVQKQVAQEEPVKEEKKEEEKIPLTAEELQNAKTKKYIGIGLSVIVVILPFFVRGGKIGGGWYVLMAIGALLSFCFAAKVETKKDKEGLDFAIIILAIIAAIMFIWGPINPKYY